MPTENTDDELAFSLNDGSERRLRNWRDVQRFLDQVEEGWEWLRHLTRHQDPADMRNQVMARIQNLRNEAQRVEDAGGTPASIESSVLETFNNSQGPFLPDSESGRVILDILEAAGPEAAVTAFAFQRGHLGIGSVIRPAQLLGLMMLALPGAAPILDGGKRLAKERETLRSTTRRLAREVEDAEVARAGEWSIFTSEAKSAALRWTKRRAQRLVRRMRDWEETNQASVDKISDVERSYREFMQLKAPVEYWEDKASAHRKSEHMLRWIVMAFFVLATASVIYMFREAAVFILNETTPTRALPSGLFFIISAGLASTAGLLFWGGRLLTKLYLSEHHLRHDAEERAKMTQTYLALTAEGAASEADRQIILTALFRNTPDGIVKEDGAIDPSLAAVFAKLMSR